MNNILSYLKNKHLIWQGKAINEPDSGSLSGYPELDAGLEGGLPTQGVIDIHSDIGIGELRLFLPYILQRQARQQRLLVIIAPPLQINGEMLAELGIDLNQVLVIRPGDQQQALWAAEQCLKSDCCHTVLSWLQNLEIHQVKRLQLAAKQSHAVQVIFRQQQTQGLSLPVTLSMSLQPQAQGLRIKVNKRIGSWRHQDIQLNMQALWPALQLPEQHNNDNNIIPFPKQRAS
ncbi:translesion DNA synthesis-associated protein ImuA [Planctobacterium marinum]|uniref:translesion DNA synthesis-associated protein ImuA n=1 Tax=Planctobacterium marinum TaxID=1631968 RepID=UPI001E341EF5|nr:translesion DNA synthesis-associated protein ImuA [Planctobacterium marinum]MCC2606408.1 translesion DNA synthesis-associated protein ImuA [Planctobacterium marinum]